MFPHIRKSTAFLEGSHAIPACPSDKNSINTKMTSYQSALRQVHSPFQTEFSTECDLVLPLFLSCYFLHFHKQNALIKIKYST